MKITIKQLRSLIEEAINMQACVSCGKSFPVTELAETNEGLKCTECKSKVREPAQKK